MPAPAQPFIAFDPARPADDQSARRASPALIQLSITRSIQPKRQDVQRECWNLLARDRYCVSLALRAHSESKAGWARGPHGLLLATIVYLPMPSAQHRQPAQGQQREHGGLRNLGYCTAIQGHL